MFAARKPISCLTSNNALVLCLNRVDLPVDKSSMGMNTHENAKASHQCEHRSAAIAD